MDWFVKSYPNVTLNQDGGIFCLQWMNGIQGIKPGAPQYNLLLDTVVKMKK